MTIHRHRRGARALTALATMTTLVLGATLLAGPVHAAPTESDKALSALGRVATKDEVKAWDIDVQPDLTGLPPGKGTVDQGIDVWESKCTSCHGIFGESNEVFTPLVGGTTDEDIASGHVANLKAGSTYPQRTTLMKASEITALWDYINRAMPWNAPKSLSADEVYAVLAYLLHLGNVVPDDFELSDKTMAEAQARLPNRHGMKFYEPLWRVDGTPDVQGSACMNDCETELDVRSFLPDYARNAHGNLAEQNRVVGPIRGADTTRPAPKTLDETRQLAQQIQSKASGDKIAVAAADAAAPAGPDESALAEKSGCLACHDLAAKKVGPSFKDVAKRYHGKPEMVQVLADHVRKGNAGTWGAVPMPANAHVSEEDATRLVRWILELR